MAPGFYMAKMTALEAHDHYVMRIMSDPKGFLKNVLSSEKYNEIVDEKHISCRMEFPVGQRGGYNGNTLQIKGYIDILIEIDVCRYIAVEVKSHIKSITETVRQINTHKSFLSTGIYVLASPDDRFVDILKSQGIKFVKLEKLPDVEPEEPDTSNIFNQVQ